MLTVVKQSLPFTVAALAKETPELIEAPFFLEVRRASLNMDLRILLITGN